MYGYNILCVQKNFFLYALKKSVYLLKTAWITIAVSDYKNQKITLLHNIQINFIKNFFMCKKR